jgi:hypothetical protein
MRSAGVAQGEKCTLFRERFKPSLQPFYNILHTQLAGRGWDDGIVMILLVAE